MRLHQEIERFLRATGMPPTTFGRLAVNDPRLVRDVRVTGRAFRKTTADRIRAFMEGYNAQ